MIGCLCISRLSVSFLYVPISLFDCNRPEKCTRSRKDPRKIRRWEHEDEIDAMHQQLKEASDTPLIRKQTVEHLFGTIKMWMGATHYLTKRLKM